MSKSLQIDRKTLDWVQKTSFLAVILTYQLSWRAHICHVASKIAKAIGIIYKSKYVLPKKSLLSLYYSLVYRYLNCCNLIWASAYKTNLHRIILLQKRVVWTIDNKDYRGPSDPSFKNLKVLKVFEINSLQTGIFMFSYCNHLLPSSLDNLFTSGSLVHSYNTRFGQNIRPHKSHATLKQISISYQGPLFWNSLSKHLTSMTSLANFTFSLKCELLWKYSR